jgi:protein ImuA
MTTADLRHLLDRFSSRSPSRGDDGDNAFRTGLPAIDRLMPKHGLSRAAVHELLMPLNLPMPRAFALLLARSAMKQGAIVWCDPQRTLYPPAVRNGGIPLERLILLRPRNDAEAIWAVAECLRCRGVDAIIAAPARLTQVEARRLQLAAEAGGGAGILIRPQGRASTHYAAATRWLVTPAPGKPSVQRWKIQLLHGHGGRVGESVLLEVNRETHHVRASEALADRPPAAKASRAS